METTKGKLRRAAALAVVSLAALGLGGCASFYVDTATKDVAVSEYKKPAQPKPTQLVFEFQTKGAPNAGATDYLRKAVTDQINESGMFGALSDKAASDLPILNVVINNVPLDDNAMGKGFVTGLTFGAAGNVVTDGYICQVNYLAPGASKPVTGSARHAIHAALGSAQAPANAVKVDNMDIAARTMTRQIVGNALRDLSENADFVAVAQ